MRAPRLFRVLFGKTGPHRAAVQDKVQEAKAQSTACTNETQVAQFELGVAIARQREATRRLLDDVLAQKRQADGSDP